MIRVPPGDTFLFSRIISKHLFRTAFSGHASIRSHGTPFEGEPVHLKEKLELISEAVAFGSIQIPPDGQPIVLLADRQTTGGYPRIGEVATVDLPLIAQAMPGANLYFKRIDHQDAEQALFKQEAELKELGARIKLEAFV